jgi:hypothetical protein
MVYHILRNEKKGVSDILKKTMLISTHFVYAYCFVYIVHHICDFEIFCFEQILFF